MGTHMQGAKLLLYSLSVSGSPLMEEGEGNSILFCLLTAAFQVHANPLILGINLSVARKDCCAKQKYKKRSSPLAGSHPQSITSSLSSPISSAIIIYRVSSLCFTEYKTIRPGPKEFTIVNV